MERGQEEKRRRRNKILKAGRCCISKKDGPNLYNPRQILASASRLKEYPLVAREACLIRRDILWRGKPPISSDIHAMAWADSLRMVPLPDPKTASEWEGISDPETM
jgi:hypothetical protein